MDHFWTGIITVATAIVGLAIIAVLVSNKAQTSSVIGASSAGFANDLVAATSPVTGASATVNTSGSGSTIFGGFGGFAGQGGAGNSQPF
jgi:hypothetical protein